MCRDVNQRPLLQTPRSRSQAGFTLAELSAVIVIVGVVMALLMPALASSKRKAEGIFCLNNLRQIQTAWAMYTEDHSDWLPGVTGGSMHERGKWISGWLDFSENPDNTNSALLLQPKDSQLGSYLKTAAIYRCPSDRSVVRINGRVHPRVRSVSMNCWMNYIGSAQIGQDAYRVFRKYSDIVEPSPAAAWVFMDERPDSINDGMFQTDLKNRRSRSKIIDYPASSHNGGAGVIFADGHAETKRWFDRRTMPVIRGGLLLQLGVASPNNPDVAWLQEHSSGPLAP